MANWANQYLTVPYVDGGRTLAGLDCWGLVRHVLHQHFNLPLLTSFGHVHPDNKLLLTNSYRQIIGKFKHCEAQVESIAAGFQGKNLIHVGVCIEIDGYLKILHTSRKHGVSLNSTREFKRLFTKVVFYQYDRNN